MRSIWLAFTAGIVLLALIGFFSPIWYLGFAPLGVGAIWASYDLIDDAEDTRGDTAGPPRS
jgi:hypothetical protein